MPADEHADTPSAPDIPIGSRWVWEIDQPRAIAVVEVLGLSWNGEEWMVHTRTLLGRKTMFGEEIDQETERWNDAGRFLEACSLVHPIQVKIDA